MRDESTGPENLNPGNLKSGCRMTTLIQGFSNCVVTGVPIPPQADRSRIQPRPGCFDAFWCISAQHWWAFSTAAKWQLIAGEGAYTCTFSSLPLSSSLEAFSASFFSGGTATCRGCGSFCGAKLRSTPQLHPATPASVVMWHIWVSRQSLRYF